MAGTGTSSFEGATREMRMKTCNRCGIEKPVDQFQRDRGYFVQPCKPCDSLRQLAYIAKDSKRRQVKLDRGRADYLLNRDAYRAYKKRYFIAHKDELLQKGRERAKDPRDKARRDLRAAVRRGTISKPAHCSDCGARGRIEGHHADYSKPFDVEWLCSLCHGKRHRVVLEVGDR